MANKRLEKKIAQRFDQLEVWFPTRYKRDDFRLKYVFRQLNDPSGKKILDVGCGKGGMVRALMKTGAEVHGIDVSKKLLDFAKKIPGAKIKFGSATDIPYPNSSFDFIICSEVVEHVEKPEEAIKEMARALKKNGKLILIDKNKWSFHQRLWFEIVYTWNYRKNIRMYPQNFPFRQRWFSKKGTEKQMRRHFRKVTSSYLNTPLIGSFIGWTGVK